jgi:hypothetical protein
MEPETAVSTDTIKTEPSAISAPPPQSLMAGFIREGNGKLSSSRLLVLLWGGGVFLIWAIASLQGETLQAIPDSVITIVGVLISAKTVQRFGE